jgi:hypothetical protein
MTSQAPMPRQEPTGSAQYELPPHSLFCVHEAPGGKPGPLSQVGTTGIGAGAHEPKDAIDASASAASHTLLYVFWSQPQTGGPWKDEQDCGVIWQVPIPWQEPVGSSQYQPLPQSRLFVQLVPTSGRLGPPPVPPPEPPPGTPGGSGITDPELELLPDVEPDDEPEVLPEPEPWPPRPPASPDVAPLPASPPASPWSATVTKPASPPHPSRRPEDTSSAQAARRAHRARVVRGKRESVMVFMAFQFC